MSSRIAQNVSGQEPASGFPPPFLQFWVRAWIEARSPCLVLLPQILCPRRCRRLSSQQSGDCHLSTVIQNQQTVVVARRQLTIQRQLPTAPLGFSQFVDAKIQNGFLITTTSRVRRFTRRGGRPHRIERLRNKINTAPLNSLSALFHTGTNEAK